MKTTIVYKVCFWASDGYRSAVITDKPLYYEIGKITKPKFGKIFVFKSLCAAHSFINKNPTCFSIFRCEAKNVKRKIIVCGVYGQDTLKYFWQKPCFKVIAPAKTYVCDWVKPIEKVH